MVLVTDGEDLEKGGAKMALELSKQGAVIYTIGVGTPAGAEITSVNPQGQVEVLKDKNGEVVRSRLDEPTLRAIAQASGGEYYPMGPLGEGFAKVRLALEGTGGREGSAPRRKFGVDRFHYPLAMLLLLLVAEPLIGTRRKA
jgi:Ca-activated chloride channel family protein